MPAVYEEFGVRLLYPENWVVSDEEIESWPRSVTLQSESTSFWSLHVFPPDHDARQAVTDLVETIREGIPDAEVLPMNETYGETETKGVDIAYFFLDLLVEAKVRCVRTPSALLVWHSQAESREYDRMEEVFRAIATSMLTTQATLS
jgi:hypothetical protein